MAVARAPATTSDALFGGRVSLLQPARGRGYRVNVDAILLAAFAAGPRKTARAAFDLGAGVGAVGLSLLHLGGASRVTMIESDATLARLASANANANGWSDRITVLRGDVEDASLAPDGAADLVVCNPPYVPPGRGRPPAPSRARAKSGPLDVFLDAARRIAGRRARICVVYPAIELTTLLTELRARGLEPKRLRLVHGKEGAPARVALVESVAGKRGGLAVEAPLVETAARGPARA
ncbi:MAG: methyltransferase [Labilithrix sp.]|nr:methyltransferase [Labilithrix sp.]